MSNWQGFAIGLCTISLIGAALHPLMPNSGMGKLLRFILTACFLGVLLSPISGISGFRLPDFSIADQKLDEAMVKEQVRKQVEEQINAVLTDEANQALSSYKLSVKKAEAKVDIDENGGISISQVQIYLDARNRENRTTILQVLRKQFGESVVIADG